jgi:5S rRNA maturation endonuclease (ribonuclease M5)
MEKHKNREIIILTDFDRKGRLLAAKMRSFLQSRKIHANSRLRSDIMNLGINRIEELASLRGLPGLVSVSRSFRNKECDDYGEIGANFNKIRDKGLHKGKGSNRKA